MLRKRVLDSCATGTQGLGKQAARLHEADAILWLRGVPTEGHLKVPLPPESTSVLQLGDLMALSALDGPATGFTDGPGGRQSSDHRLRRTGWSWCITSPRDHSQILMARWACLEGERQTVPRVESFAMYHIVERVPANFALKVWSDAK